MKIFVAKLNLNTQEPDLREAFEEYGEVSSSTIVFDRVTNRSKGFGFVEMPNDDEAIRAIQEGRKNLGFDVSDRIALVWWSDDQDTIAAIEGGKQLLASEVLATIIGQADDAPVNGTACVELNAVFEIIKSSIN